MSKNNPTSITKHHRKPRSRGGHGKPENISHVTDAKHKAFHVLFADRHPMEIAEILTAIWIDPAYKLICVRRKDHD